MELRDIDQEILKEFNKPGLQDQMRRVQRIRDQRILRECRRPTIIDWEGDSDRGYYDLKPPPGTIILFWARRGSELLESIEGAYLAKDEKALRSLSEGVREQVSARQVRAVSELVDEIEEGLPLFDFRYGSKVLAPNLCLPEGIDCGSMLFAWNGGRLDANEFIIAELTEKSPRSDYDVLVVRSAPKLTAIERAALEAVPADQLHLNVGVSAVCGGWCVVLIVVIVLVTNAGQCGQLHDRLAEVTLPRSEIREIGALSSALELMNARRSLLEKALR